MRLIIGCRTRLGEYHWKPVRGSDKLVVVTTHVQFSKELQNETFNSQYAYFQVFERRHCRLSTRNYRKFSSVWILEIWNNLFFSYLKAKEVKLCEIEFNSEFISRMIPKLDWPALFKAAENVQSRYFVIPANIPLMLFSLQVGHSSELPSTLVDDYESNEEFLKKAHHVLLEV